MPKLAESKEAEQYWFQYPSAGYPAGVIVCPLCGLPETEGKYSEECDCWDGREETVSLAGESDGNANEIQSG